MKPIITTVIISALKGESGSNPEIHTCFPNDSGIKRNKIIDQVLPTGCRNSEVYEFTYKGQDLLVFVTELNNNGSRNDVVTLSFLLNDHAEKDTIMSILKTIFSEFQVVNLEIIDELTNLAKKLYTGINSHNNFQFNGYAFDIHGYLNTTGMSLERKARKVRGELF